MLITIRIVIRVDCIVTTVCLGEIIPAGDSYLSKTTVPQPQPHQPLCHYCCLEPFQSTYQSDKKVRRGRARNYCSTVVAIQLAVTIIYNKRYTSRQP